MIYKSQYDKTVWCLVHSFVLMIVILGTVKDRGVFENMSRLSLLATLSTLVNLTILAKQVNLAKQANLANLVILFSLAISPVVGLKIEASTESFTDGFADPVPNGDLLVAEGSFFT